MTANNILFILSDEHTRWAAGCYGGTEVHTPVLDGLASRGIRFEHAFTPVPICVPARACLATGRLAHEIGAWDNGKPYLGTEAPSWGRVLTEAGYRVTTVGKLHYRTSTDDTGFNDQRIPMHVAEGIGDTLGLLRGEMPTETENRGLILQAGPGESDYTRYDRAICTTSCRWLREESRSHTDGWALAVSFCAPHPPLLAPPEFFGRYDAELLDLPVASAPESWPRHPALDRHRVMQGHDRPLQEHEIRTAVAAYLGLTSYLDSLVGELLAALDETGQSQATTVIYTSDHGEMLGAHGLWWKSCMYEGAVGVPLLVAGPGIAAGRVCATNVSLIDLFPTLVQLSGARTSPDMDLAGESVIDVAHRPHQDRTVFAEYHANYSASAMYMLVDDSYKYVHYTGESPQLFARDTDPSELLDLASEPDFAPTLSRYGAALRQIVDPDGVDREAKADQLRRIENLGGVDSVRARREMAYTPAPTSDSELNGPQAAADG